MEYRRGKIGQIFQEKFYQLNKTDNHSIDLMFADTNYTFEKFEILARNSYMEGIFKVSGKENIVSIKIMSSTNITRHGTDYIGAISPNSICRIPISKYALVKVALVLPNGQERTNPAAIIDIAEFTICPRQSDILTFEIFDEKRRIIGKSSDWIGVTVDKFQRPINMDFNIHGLKMMVRSRISDSNLSTLPKYTRWENSISFMKSTKKEFRCHVNNQTAQYTEFKILNKVISTTSECLIQTSKGSHIWYKTRMTPLMIRKCKRRYLNEIEKLTKFVMRCLTLFNSGISYNVSCNQLWKYLSSGV
ncbi:hypothetical protein RF11_06270 [Thelohanellus kitauei]|uniref:Uncharacterized protein n=1 Tax=Thelohanellus kitauei TaxID=669202 RepID=A0A0C2MG54_THEKT|nr:hypothetical protein RF11_06270 [Thelohanellus kitauei]